MRKEKILQMKKRDFVIPANQSLFQKDGNYDKEIKVQYRYSAYIIFSTTNL